MNSKSLSKPRVKKEINFMERKKNIFEKLKLDNILYIMCIREF